MPATLNGSANKKSFVEIGDRIRWGYLLAFLLLLISYFLSFYTNKKLLNEANWINNAHGVMDNLEVLVSDVNETNSGLNGYFVTSDATFLTQYNNNKIEVNTTFHELKSASKKIDIGHSILDSINYLINRKFTLDKLSLDQYYSSRAFISGVLKKESMQSKLIMDSIRILKRHINSEVNKLMVERSGQIVSFSHFINVVNISSLLIAIVMIFYSLLAFNKENTAKKEADLETIKYRDQLELRITELDKLNAELVELKSIEKFSLTGRISRTIAHEVRNPLTNINLAVEQLKIELNSDEESTMLLDMISRNGTRINQLISDLLNSTRTNLLNFEKRNINDLLDESLQYAADRIELKEIKVIKQYTKENCNVDVDTQKINIALLNIIVNACEAMEPLKGILTLKSEMKNNKCIVTIGDNGKGIDAENVNRLFEPYFTTKEFGTGLGLTNTQNIILSHKASISAESNPGKGTRFFIIFNC